MQAQYLNQKLNFALGQGFQPRIQDGRFTIVNKTNAKFTCELGDSNALLELATDFTCVGRKKFVAIDSAYSDYSGINEKFISDTGSFDAEAALADFAKNAASKRLVNEKTDTLIKRGSYEDSHHVFIYNMLISWMKAWLYKNCNGSDNTFTVKSSPYKDSHRTISTGFGGEEFDHLITLGCPNPDMEDTSIGERNHDNYWTAGQVIYVNNMTNSQLNYYYAHVGGRTTATELNFDVDLPGIEGNWVFECAHAPMGHLEEDDAPWDNAETQWAWIMDYVVLNRLQSQFASCFETLSAACFQPSWSSQEACMWQEAELRFNFSKFSPTRAVIRSSLEGVAYRRSDLPRQFILDEAQYYRQHITHAAIMNYYMWYGLYALLHNECQGIDGWRNVCNGMSEVTQVLFRPEMRAYCISAVTGQEMTTLMSPGANFTVGYAQVLTVKDIAVEKVHDGSPAGPITVDKLYAPVSGSLLLGAFGGNLEMVEHLQAMQSFGALKDRCLYMDDLTTLKYANMYRLFGYDTTFEDRFRHLHKAWGNVREAVIEPASIIDGNGTPETLRIVDTVAREGRNYTLPHILNLVTANATMTIMRPTLVITEYQKRHKPITHRVELVRKRRTPEFRVKAAYVSAPQHLKVTRRVAGDPAGFGMADPDVPPREPITGVPEEILADPIPVDTGDPDIA
jgi:hypothetical protein